MPREVMGPKRGPLNFPGRAAPGWDNTTDRLGYDGSGRNITKRYLSAKPNAQYGYADTTALVGQTTAYDHGGNKFYERSLQAVDRSNLYQPVDNSGNIASPTPGYDSVGRLLQYQRGELNSTGGYQNNGGGSVAAAIALPNTDQSRNYTLDGLGNWRATGFTPVGSAAQVDRRNNNYVNQITQRSVAGGTAVVFEYDNNSSPLPGNGNLTYDGTLNYQYDALNRLIGVNRVSDGAAIAAYVYDAGNRRVRKTVTNGGLAGNIPNGTTDSCWFGWQTMEERNPSGGTDTPTKQYVWGNYIDECLQLNLLAVAGPQQLAVGVYYPLQDTLYRTMALVNSSGTPVEAYDTDAYGNTLISTGSGPDDTWFTDDDTQSSYGANGIIYCGYRYDAETENYYVRNRYYSPTLGRWLSRDPIGYQGGINLYGYVNSSPVGMVDAWGTVPWLTFSEGGWTYTSSGNPATATVTPANVPNPAAASAGPPPPFGLPADRWENPGAHFVGGMGKFTAQIGWMSAYSSGVVVTFFPGNRLKNKKCGCKLIGFVQYEKDATAFSSHGSVALPSGWSVDGGFPYPHQTEWSPGGKHYAELRDAPGLRYLGPYLYNQWVFEARDVAVCLSGHDKGDSFGAVYWRFYFNWGAGRVTRWVGGQGVKTGPVTSQNVSVDILRPFAPLP